MPEGKKAMPELPEVETIARRLVSGTRLEPPLVGRHIVRVDVASSRIVQEPSAAELAQRLAGARVLGVRRRAKHLLVDTDRGVLVLHLRMTGDLHVRRAAGSGAEPPPRFLRASFVLDDGSALQFTDSRHLGEIRLVDDPASLLAELGPEPLDPAFTADALAARLTGSRAIKAALLDQSVVGGVGNIYSDEALFRARLWPERPTSSLTPAEVKRLHKGIVDALQDSIDSLAKDDLDVRWRYLNRTEESPFFVYDRGGEPCRRCGAKLRELEVAGRTTVACPVCQGGPARAAKRPRPSGGGTCGLTKKAAKGPHAAKSAAPRRRGRSRRAPSPRSAGPRRGRAGRARGRRGA